MIDTDSGGRIDPSGKRPAGKTPDSKVPNSKIPNSKVPDSRAPDSKIPDSKIPDSKSPSPKAPVVPDRDRKDRTDSATKPGTATGTVALPRPEVTGGWSGRDGRNPPERIVDPPEQFVGDTVFGVPVAKANPTLSDRGPVRSPRTDGGSSNAGSSGGGGASGGTSGGTTVINNGSNNSTVINNTVLNDHSVHNTYVRNVSNCNGWNSGSRWSDCGPCPTWQRYDCHDGASFSVGFGFGFSFGFFYGSSCAPLCTSWCNPWWEGYAVSWTCRPAYSRWSGWCRTRYTYWDPCRPWWESWTACGPCPAPAWTPCYTWSPCYRPAWYVTAPVYTTAVVYTAPPPPALPNPDAMWTFLADGYDRDAEDGFVLLEAAYPGDERWTMGQAFARAFRSDTVRASDLFRDAFAGDPSAVRRLSADPKFISRLEALERSLAPAAAMQRPSVDVLLVLAATQAARGDLTGAYINATTAEAEGDRSSGTAAFVSWLRAELRQRP